MLFLIIIQVLCLLTFPIAADGNVCEPGLRQCAPVGASRRGMPVMGPDLARLFLELVYTVQGIPDSHTRHPGINPGLVSSQEVEGDSLCCAEAAFCNLIRSFRIAFCWDHFTTSYFLPDGSYGSVANGSYTTPAGDTANLITGEYHMKDGTHGNIYDESPADKPDTTNLPMPTPWTSSGVGAAIPASQLGAQDTTVAPWSTTATRSSAPSSITESITGSGSSSYSVPSSSAASTTILTQSESSTSASQSITSTTETSSTASATTTSFEGVHNSTVLTSGGSAMVGSAGASGTSTNVSSPIVPPITNLAAATVVYCMAVKVLAWMVTALMMA